MQAIVPRVKICCISSADEVRLAAAYGVAALGLVSAMPSGPGVISEELIAEIASEVPPGVTPFLLTSRTSPAPIAEQARRARVHTVQLCDRLPDGAHQELKRRLPDVGLVQVIHVTGEESLVEAGAVAPHVDAILLDSGNRTLAVKQLGGTGRRHDWEVSRRIREFVSKPVYLAGGLRAENVGEAIRTVRPFGVDVCTGVRSSGHLDEGKLAAFVKAVAAAAC